MILTLVFILERWLKTLLAQTNTNHSDKYTFFRQDICKMAFDALDMDLDQGKLLPAVLVGGLGGSCIIPMLRLLVAISENGKELGGKLMKAGIVPPVSDILLSSLSGMPSDKFALLHYFQSDLA